MKLNYEETQISVDKPAVISRHPFQRQSVDIIVPFHGEYPKVIRLVESFFRTIRGNTCKKCRITLVDDCSPNETFLREFRKTPGVSTIRHKSEKPLGFGAALNTGLENTEHDWVCFAHSDVVFDNDQWLSGLGRTIMELKGSGVKMVSPKTNNSDVGDERVIADKFVVNKDKDGNPFYDDIVLTDTYLPMFCFLAHRELFERIGPIKSNPYLGGEPQEFAERMRDKGYKQAISGGSWVWHEGGGTINNLVKKSPKIKEIVDKNKGLMNT